MHPIAYLGLARVAQFHRAMARQSASAHQRKLEVSAAWLERLIQYLKQQEKLMGRVAQDISKLETALAAEKSRGDRLQQQLDAATANALDAEDLAALANVESQLPDAPPAPEPEPTA
jgi:peptidoglycan hydrolase CwlO-like protein